MKNSIFKLITGSILATGIALIASCSGGETTNTSGTAPESMINKPAADNGEGIGKFHNVNLAAFDASLAASGRGVFETKCSACHKTTEQKIVGPGLKGVTQRRKPAWILNMITNPEEMTKKDPQAMKLLEEHLTQMTFQNVSDDEAIAILEYMREIDGEGSTAQH
jgi:cytochrome c5